MSVKIWLLGLVVFSTLALTNSQLLQAIAVVRSGNGRIHGNITFSQNDGGAVTIFGKLRGLSPGIHGIHIHQTGDITSGCRSTGEHFNPFKTKHGGLLSSERHVGDLGNIVASPEGVALLSLTDNVVSLQGPYGILGRSIVTTSDPDDQGKGGFSDSLTTGHSGAREACGVIGLLTPLDKFYTDVYPLNASGRMLPLKTLLLPLLAIIRLNY